MLWYQTRLAAFVLSAALVLPGSAGLPAASASDEPEEKVLLRYGDINGDKRIDASDALIALQHSVALVQLKGDDFIVANVDGKQGVGSSDALLILQRSVGLNRLFPAEEEPVFDRILDAELSMQESSYRSISGEQIQQLCDSLQSDGSWLGINYADQGNAGWNPPSHLSNIRNMLAASGRQRIAADAQLRTKALLALDYWLQNDFRCPNWWYNDISVPATLSVICLFLQDYLNDQQKLKCTEILLRGTLSEITGDKGLTGANLMWELKTTIKHALLRRDADMMIYAADLLESSVTIGEDEGIQLDQSFFQHGHQLAMGHYGWSFVGELTPLCQILTGTPFQMSSKKLNQIARYITEGTRYVVYGDRWNYFALGRSLFRNNSLSAGSVASQIRRFAAIDELEDKEKEAVLTAADALDGKASDALPDKYFDIGKYYCRLASGYYIGARVTDSSIVGGEICNGEGVLGYNLASGGAQCILVDGREYDNIAPVWDYAKIPGVTTLLEEDEAIAAKTGWSGAPAQNVYCGGMTDGSVGVIYMDLNHNGVTGVISRFFIDGGMIALGAGLSSASGRVVTTVNQCWNRSEISINGNTVVHDNITYLNLCSTPWEAAAEHRTGSWQRVATESSDTQIEGDVFSLWYDHGEAAKEAQYAYALLPNRSDSSLNAEALEIEVLQNTPACQAIRVGKTVLAVFHTAGSLPVTDGLILTGEAHSAQIVSLAR